MAASDNASNSIKLRLLLQVTKNEVDQILGDLKQYRLLVKYPSAVVVGADRKRRLPDITNLDIYTILQPTLTAHSSPPEFVDAISAIHRHLNPPKDVYGWLTGSAIEAFVSLVVADAQSNLGKRVWCHSSTSYPASFEATRRKIVTALPKTRGRGSREVDGHEETCQSNAQSIWNHYIKKPDRDFLRDVDQVLIPFNHSNNHWTLLNINVQRRRLQVLDPLDRPTRPEFALGSSVLRCALGDGYSHLHWLEETVKMQIQTDQSSCGVWLCINALAFTMGLQPRDFIDDENKKLTKTEMKSARKYIAACIKSQSILKGTSGTVFNPICLGD